MYKIYINETQLILCKSTEVQTLKSRYKKGFFSSYSGKIKHLLSYIDMLEKTDRYKTIVLYHDNYKLLKSDFVSLFKEIVAAGGIVINEEGAGLFIFKRGVWDLPKGKLEPKESLKDAAIREVQEETGVKDITLQSKICITKHVFRLASGKRAIKISHWYHFSAQKQELTPQYDEGIEEVEWLDIDTLVDSDLPFYSNLKKVVKKFIKKSKVESNQLPR